MGDKRERYFLTLSGEDGRRKIELPGANAVGVIDGSGAEFILQGVDRGDKMVTRLTSDDMLAMEPSAANSCFLTDPRNEGGNPEFRVKRVHRRVDELELTADAEIKAAARAAAHVIRMLATKLCMSPNPLPYKGDREDMAADIRAALEVIREALG